MMEFTSREFLVLQRCEQFISGAPLVCTPQEESEGKPHIDEELIDNVFLIFLNIAPVVNQSRAKAVELTKTKKRPGRPKGTAAPVAKPKQKRKISSEGLARIAAAQKARWAAQRKAAK
jgi:hypothetical protein